MADSLHLITILPANPEPVFHAWLDSAEHTAFTGSPARIDPTVGGRFTAWDGYIQGATLELSPCTRILQSWRTTEFPEDSPDSSLEVLLEPAESGTRLILNHTGIPEGQGEQYRQGWEDYYFTPMQAYFSDKG